MDLMPHTWFFLLIDFEINQQVLFLNRFRKLGGTQDFFNSQITE
jgi:hypothetical protein